MTVIEMIGLLNALPRNAEVWILSNGEPRLQVENVWLSKDGRAMVSEACEVCYSDGARAIGAPTPSEEPYWQTPRM